MIKRDVAELPVVVDVDEPLPDDPIKKIYHSVVFPPGYPIPQDLTSPVFLCSPPDTLPIEFPYILDPFQRRAIGALSIGHSVLVAAHTSAGKTTVAEYVIASALARNQRVVYTTPIKALSNQKYHDLKTAAYTNGSVGLMTGDSTLNRNAFVLVMTTEVLRNMLHQGAELLREIGHVIFDEVHYMRNSERGLVWEDCIAMVDSKIKFCFLSATVPNATEFAGWVASLHNIPVHVVYTQYRPVPLMHYICPVGGKGIHPICSSAEQNKLHQDNVKAAKSNLPYIGAAEAAKGEGPITSGHVSMKERNKAVTDTLHKVMRFLIGKDVFPIIIFAFGKKKCEVHASNFVKHYFGGKNSEGTEEDADEAFEAKNLLTPDQVRMVDAIFNAALESLPEDTQSLRPIVTIHQLLRRGVAIHHSGLLPWVKELIEILFVEGLVKILYATETFAMGLNLPARAIIFSEMKKFDGSTSRFITPGEYVQMAGRAGRRGIDSQGLSICLFNTVEECDSIVKVIQGTTEPLNSAYRLSFNSVLNLLQVESSSPEEVIKRSFLSFQQSFRLPRCLQAVQHLESDNDEDRQRINHTFSKSIDRLLQWSSSHPREPLFSSEVLAALKEQAIDFSATISEYLQISALQECLELDQINYVADARLLTSLVPGRIISAYADGIRLGWVIVIRRSTYLEEQYVDVLVPTWREALPPGYDKRSDQPMGFMNSRKMSQEKIDENSDVVLASLKGNGTYQAYVAMRVKRKEDEVTDPEPPTHKQVTSTKKEVQTTVDVMDVNDLVYESRSANEVSEDELHKYSFMDIVQPYALEERRLCNLIAPLNIEPYLLALLEAKDPDAALNTFLDKVGACIIRLPVSAITGISKKRLNSVPSDISNYNDRIATLALYARMFLQLLRAEDDPMRRTLDIVLTPFSLDDLADHGLTDEAQAAQLRLQGIRHMLRWDIKYRAFTEFFLARGEALDALFSDEGGFKTITDLLLCKALTVRRRDTKVGLFKAYIEEADKLVLEQELQNLKRFLRRESFLEQIEGGVDNVLTQKGRIACHISTANEVILTECLFDGSFASLPHPILAGVLTSLIGERSTTSKKLEIEPPLRQALGSLKALVNRLLADCVTEETSLELGCTTVEDIVSDSAAVIAFAWASGKTFEEVIDIDPTQFEGSIVRMFRRLINLVEQLMEAADILNDTRLKTRLESVHKAVFRDIVHVTSLYVVDEEDA